MAVMGSTNSFTVQVVGKEKIQRAIMNLKRKGENPRKTLEKLVIVIQQSTDKNFRVGGRPKWPMSRRATEQHGKTLLDENFLRASVTTRAIVKVGRKEIVYGTKEKKAPYLHFGFPSNRGGRGGPRVNPKRPFLGIYKEDEKKIERILKDDMRMSFMGVGI